jgi:hypothetical protein
LADCLTEIDRLNRKLVEKKALSIPNGYPEAVQLWFENYKIVYGTTPIAWGAKQGRSIKNILLDSPIEELRELIPQFFHGPYPDSIREGHPLSSGYASLAMRIAMLRADIANPKRRVAAAIAAKRLQLADEIAAETDATNRMNIQSQLQRDPLNDNQWRTTDINNRDGRCGANMERAASATPGQIAEGSSTAGGDSQQKTIGSSTACLVSRIGAICQGSENLGSIQIGMRERQDAINRTVQGDSPAASRASYVHNYCASDARAAESQRSGRDD